MHLRCARVATEARSILSQSAARSRSTAFRRSTAARTDAYVRAGYGDPEHGPWLQAMASSVGYTISHTSNNGLRPTEQRYAAERHHSLSSAVHRAGWSHPRSSSARGGRAVSASAISICRQCRCAQFAWRSRLAERAKRTLWTPSGRVEFVTGPLSVSAFAEGLGPDSLNRAEVTARLTPLPFVSVRRRGRDEHRPADSRLELQRRTSFVAEAAIRLFGGLWLSGGMLRRDSTLLVPPRVFGAPFVAVEGTPATGFMATVEGTIYKALRVDAFAVRWNDTSGFYRPRYQTRSRALPRNAIG